MKTKDICFMVFAKQAGSGPRISSLESRKLPIRAYVGSQSTLSETAGELIDKKNSNEGHANTFVKEKPFTFDRFHFLRKNRRHISLSMKPNSVGMLDCSE